MKLTIDTATDSRDDLRKIIRFLQLMVNERDFHNLPERKRVDEVKKEADQSVQEFFNIMDTSPQPVKEPPKKEFKIGFF